MLIQVKFFNSTSHVASIVFESMRLNGFGILLTLLCLVLCE